MPGHLWKLWRLTCQHCKSWQRVAKGTSTGQCGYHGNVTLEDDSCPHWDRAEKGKRPQDGP